MAPLVVGDLVFAGISAGDTGLRGFLDAYHAETGERAWRFWTIPAPGEPGSETWGDPEVLRRGCGATWLTGSYDAQLDLLYWATGNPCPDMNGDRRPGDNLWTNSVLALRPATGELVWHFQFTPHDTHDWDAQEPLLLIDEEFRGQPRKLLVQGNRNGFFYVHRPHERPVPAGRAVRQPDLGGRPRRLGAAHRPPRQRADRGGDGRLPGHLRRDELVVVELSPRDEAVLPDGPRVVRHLHEGGRGMAARPQLDGGATRLADGAPNRKYIRALDIRTGRTAWSYAQSGEARTFSGVLSTDGDLVFFGENSGAFAALDARSGEPLWHVQINQEWRASPMTYMVGGRQYVAIASRLGFWAFALPE